MRPAPRRATITLSRPLHTDEGVLESLTMRRPLPRDYAEIGQFGGDDIVRGMALVARLCGLTIAEFEMLSVPDFKATMAQFNILTAGAHS